MKASGLQQYWRASLYTVCRYAFVAITVLNSLSQPVAICRLPKLSVSGTVDASEALQSTFRASRDPCTATIRIAMDKQKLSKPFRRI